MPYRLRPSLLFLAALVVAAPTAGQTPTTGNPVNPVLPPAVPGHTKSALGTPAPGKAQPHGTPVVQAPKNAHAVKPPGAAAKATTKPTAGKAGAAKPAEAPVPAPAPPATTPATSEPPKGTATGMPLPRWASLRSDEVNLRSGPGTRYPIEWVYRRRDLPVQIEREFEVWRLIQDQDGVKGWVHQATLTGRRGFVVQGGEQILRRAAGDEGEAVARLKPGVVGHIRSCDPTAAWCEVQVGDYRGWLKRDAMWGIDPTEAVN